MRGGYAEKVVHTREERVSSFAKIRSSHEYTGYRCVPCIVAAVHKHDGLHRLHRRTRVVDYIDR